MSEQSTTTRNQLYNFPEYYDILFNRDVSSEASFIPAVFEHFCGRTLQSYLDLACGPGYYARAISRQGIDVIGLDASPEMITFARSKDTDDQGKVEWRVGDVRDFKIDQQVDLAAFLFDSIDNLLSIDDFVRHFQSVSRSLKPDGLYVIGQMHQRDTPIIGYGPFHYRNSRNGKDVELDWATKVKTDTRTQTAEVLLELRVTENDHTKIMQHWTRESFATPTFLEAVARLSGALEPIAWYGDFNLGHPYDDSPSSQHCISVYRRSRETGGR